MVGEIGMSAREIATDEAAREVPAGSEVWY